MSEPSLLRHALLGGMVPVLGPSFQFTSLVLNEVLIGFNLSKALSISLRFGFPFETTKRPERRRRVRPSGARVA